MCIQISKCVGSFLAANQNFNESCMHQQYSKTSTGDLIDNSQNQMNDFLHLCLAAWETRDGRGGMGDSRQNPNVSLAWIGQT